MGLSGKSEIIASSYLILSEEIEEEEQIFVNRISQELLVQCLNEYYNSTIKKHAVRTSLAQVMARNLSHNIGSHVLTKVVGMILELLYNPAYAYKKQCCYDLAKSPEIDKDCLIQEILKLGTSNCECMENFKDVTNKLYGILEKNFVGGKMLKNLLDYIRVRMDYIADITTSTPVMENTKSLKEIIDGFCENQLLTNTISGIDNFNYQITYSEDDGKKQLSIPNGILGNHAFYTIIENLIRNLAKHGKVTKGETVEFQITVDNIPERLNVNDYNEMYAVSIIVKNDIRNETKSKVCIKKDENEIWVDAADNDLKNSVTDKIDWLIYKLNSQINRSVIDYKTNTLRQGGWGLLEMEASAAYLRKIPMEDIEEDQYEISCDLIKKNAETNEYGLSDDDTYYSKDNKLNIFKAYKVQEEEKNYLAYRFFVYKPREVLIIGKDEDIFENYDGAACCDKKDTEKCYCRTKKEWLKEGIKIIEQIKEGEVYPHKLVVDKNNSINKNNAACFSTRVLKDGNYKIDSRDDAATIIFSCWQKFILEKKGLIPANHSEYYTLTNRTEYSKDVLADRYTPPSDHGQKYNVGEHKFEEIKMSSTESYFIDCYVPGIDVKPKIELSRNVLSRSLKIKIIDERIQHHALNMKYENKEEKIDYYSIYRKTNIFVPVNQQYIFQDEREREPWMSGDCPKEESFDLNAQNFNEPVKYEEENNSYKKIIEYINKTEMDFCVIHLGIIEKMIASYHNDSSIESKIPYDKEKPKCIENFIKNEVIKNNKNIVYDKIVIISGRGKPHNIPDNIRFLNYSIAEQYLIDRRNKFAFTEAICSARKFKS
jgi:hypothetical protein